MVEIARSLSALGFQLVATRGTAAALAAAGLQVTPVNKVAEGRPHIVDMIKNGEIALIVNTVEDRRAAVRDSYAIRRTALQARVTLFTTSPAPRRPARASSRCVSFAAYSLQDLHARLARAGN